MRIWLAIRLSCRVLLDRAFAREVRDLLDRARAGLPGDAGVAAERTQVADTVVDRKPDRRSALRSDALSLLAALQREARFVDMIQEPLGSYSDAQVGAAARDVLRDCGRVLDRIFALQPLVEVPEGSEVDVPADYDTGRYRLIGNVGSAPPLRGRLVHHGWIAARCEVPTWSGSAAARMIVAPQEIEVP